MQNIICLCLILLCVSCANEPTPPAPTTEPAAAITAPAVPDLSDLKVGMSRAEAEQILGHPTSITERATEITAIWVFESGLAPAAPPAPPQSNGIASQIGTIAITAAGMVNPIAGAVTSIGSQVYNVSTTDNTNGTPAKSETENKTLIVTLEFRDNKIFSIQRAHPSAALSP